MEIIPAYKPVGVTSTDVVVYYKKKLGRDDIMHAGALDPMAQGLLLVVLGASVAKEIETIVDWPKEYEVTGLIGFETDTWDILGRVLSTAYSNEISKYPPSIDIKMLERYFSHLEGEIDQQVPIFSNLRYRNKRMYQWAREGKAYLVPEYRRKKKIYASELKSIEYVTVTFLKNEIPKKIKQVSGDFRQVQIMQDWEQTLSLIEERFSDTGAFPFFNATISSEKGTYVRSIIQAMGKHIGIPATTWSIQRTRIGKYSADSADHPLD